MMTLAVLSITFGIRYDAGVNDTLDGRWIISTSDGGYAVVGTWISSGQHDIFLLKTDAYGNIQWVKTYGGPNKDWGDFVYQTSDGGYVIGGSTRSWGAGQWDIFIIKTDASGNVQWARAFGGPNGDCVTCFSRTRVEFARSVVELSSGGYLVNGVVDEPFPVTTFYYGIFTMRLDASGNLVSFRTIEKGSYAGYGFPRVLHRLPDGNYIFCALVYWNDTHWWDGLIYKVDPSGNLIWAKRYYSNPYRREGFYACTPSSDGGVILTGSSETWQGFVMKTNSSGFVDWFRSFGSTFVGDRLVQHNVLTDFWVSGSYSGQEYLMRMDITGNVLWMRTFIGFGRRVAMQLVGSDGIVSLINTGANSIFILKTDTAGNIHTSCAASSLSPLTTVYTPNVASPSMVMYSNTPTQTNVSLTAVSRSLTKVELCPLGYDEGLKVSEEYKSFEEVMDIYTVEGKRVNRMKKGIYFVKTPSGWKKVIRR